MCPPQAPRACGKDARGGDAAPGVLGSLGCAWSWRPFVLAVFRLGCPLSWLLAVVGLLGHGDESRVLISPCLGVPSRPWRLTLGVSCCWKPERGTSGGWKQSAARPCWAQGLVRGFAVETPPADRPQDAVRTPWEPTAVPDTHTSRRFQVVRDPASGASPARHPPRPARRDPRGPPAPAARVRAATLFLPVSWRHARRAAESLRALEERRPASGGAPRRDATPVQGWQGFRARASASVVLPPAPLAPNARGEPRQQPERGTSGGCWRRLQCDVRS